MAKLPRCSVCTQDIETWRVPRCAHCKAALCPLVLRDCENVHMAERHPKVQRAVDLEQAFPADEPETEPEAPAEPPPWRDAGGWQ